MDINAAKRRERIHEVILKERFLVALRLGLSVRDTCDMIGLGRSTGRLWVNRAKDLAEGEKKFNLSDGVRKFYTDVIQSLMVSKARHMGLIDQHAERMWKASAWLLSRRFPEEFGHQRELKSESAAAAVLVLPRESDLQKWRKKNDDNQESNEDADNG